MFTADSKDAKLSLAGKVDLTDGSIDARLLLSGASQNAGSRPDIFMALKGPAERADAQHRCIGADRMADIARHRQSSQAAARHRKRDTAAKAETAGATKRTGAGFTGARRYQAGSAAGRGTPASVGPQN